VCIGPKCAKSGVVCLGWWLIHNYYAQAFFSQFRPNFNEVSYSIKVVKYLKASVLLSFQINNDFAFKLKMDSFHLTICNVLMFIMRCNKNKNL
jgi:hypothetical protein